MPEKCLRFYVNEVQEAYVPTTARYLLQAVDGSADGPVLEKGQLVEVKVIDEEEN